LEFQHDDADLKFPLSGEELLKFKGSGIAGPFRLLADHEVKAVLRRLSIAKANYSSGTEYYPVACF
jgi:hypothetical protein